MSWLDGDPDVQAEREKHRQAHPNGHDPEPAGFTFVSFDEMRARLTDGYLVKHLLGSTAMAVIYGESGTGKTFLTLHLALCVAAGFQFFGHRVRRAGVVYIAAEAGRGIENRVAAAKLIMSFPSTMPFIAITSQMDLCTDKVDTENLITSIRGAELGFNIDLIIIDTLSRVMGGGNENQPDDMGKFVQNVDSIRAETGAAVVIVHHSGKDASRGARGHSLLRAATDTEIEVTCDDEVSTARVTKQREYATDGTLGFVLRQVELGRDCDDDPVTSCVVEPAAAPAMLPRHRKKTPSLSDAAKVGLQTLKKAIDGSGEGAPASNHIPPNVRVVSIETWRRYHYKGTGSDARADEARRKDFQRVREKLQAAECIKIHDDWCWLLSAGQGGT